MMSIQTTGGSSTIGKFRSLGIAGFTAFLLAIFAVNSLLLAEATTATTDDGWRRTKNGWEHISTWPAEAIQQLAVSEVSATAAQISPATERWQCLHPGVLAMGLCLVAGFALRIQSRTP